MGPFRYEPENSPGTIYSVNVVPFQRGNSAVPVSALLTAEDLTQTEQLRHLEVEAANLRLIKAMADRLAHEIGNAMVPLSTHQQLLAEKFRDAEFRKSLDYALADGVKRVSRLLNQMRFLAREGRAGAAGVSGRTTDRRGLPGGAQASACRKSPVAMRERRQTHRHHRRPRRPQTRAGGNHAQRPAGQSQGTQNRRANCTPMPATPAGANWRLKCRTTAAGFTAEAAQKGSLAVFHHPQRRAGPGPDRQPENHRNAPRQTGNCSLRHPASSASPCRWNKTPLPERSDSPASIVSIGIASGRLPACTKKGMAVAIPLLFSPQIISSI